MTTLARSRTSRKDAYSVVTDRILDLAEHLRRVEGGPSPEQLAAPAGIHCVDNIAEYINRADRLLLMSGNL